MTTRVAVADDSPEFRSLLALTLPLCGDVEVVAQASDGTEAVAIAEYMDVDLFMIDWMMPDLDGMEAVHQIRTHNDKVKLVVLTAHEVDAEVCRRAKEAGADMCMDKMTAVNVLTDLLNDVMGEDQFLLVPKKRD